MVGLIGCGLMLCSNALRWNDGCSGHAKDQLYHNSVRSSTLSSKRIVGWNTLEWDHNSVLDLALLRRFHNLGSEKIDASELFSIKVSDDSAFPRGGFYGRNRLRTSSSAPQIQAVSGGTFFPSLSFLISDKEGRPFGNFFLAYSILLDSPHKGRYHAHLYDFKWRGFSTQSFIVLDSWSSKANAMFVWDLTNGCRLMPTRVSLGRRGGRYFLVFRVLGRRECLSISAEAT